MQQGAIEIVTGGGIDLAQVDPAQCPVDVLVQREQGADFGDSLREGLGLVANILLRVHAVEQRGLLADRRLLSLRIVERTESILDSPRRCDGQESVDIPLVLLQPKVGPPFEAGDAGLAS